MRHTPWWRDAVCYQIYVRSFADGNGDGLGDLAGIRSRLPYLRDLGVDAVWLTPFYTSPQHDHGYDVADHRDVDPRFGSLLDFDALLARAHELGIAVIVDVVPNHTSSDHPWFVEALASPPGSPARERYLFRDGAGSGGAKPPNNWRSHFGGPAWTRVDDGQWYLHLFDTAQPDVNWRNVEVRDEFESILRFWLDRGVDGFRIDVAHSLYKAEGLPNAGRQNTYVTPYTDQPEVHSVYRRWRTLLEEYDGDRMAIAEAWVTDEEAMARYIRHDELQQCFNFHWLMAPWSAASFRRVVTETLRAVGSVKASATWVLSNHDVVRHTTRLTLPPDAPRPNGIRATDPQPDEALGLRRGRAASALMLALPGSAYLYQGEELGLPEHTTLPDDVRQDPAYFRHDGAVAGRDGCRVPLPWRADAEGFGFGPTGRTWLPQPASFAAYAADVQEQDPSSTLSLYRRALRVRRELGLGTGELRWAAADDDVVSFEVEGAAGRVRVLANLGATPVALPDDAQVLLRSGELDEDGRVPTDVTVWLG